MEGRTVDANEKSDYLAMIQTVKTSKKLKIFGISLPTDNNKFLDWEIIECLKEHKTLQELQIANSFNGKILEEMIVKLGKRITSDFVNK